MTCRSTARRHGGRQRWTRTAAVAVLVVCGIAVTPQASFAAPVAGTGVHRSTAAQPKHRKKPHVAVHPSATPAPHANAHASASATPRVRATASATTTATPRVRASATPRVHASASAPGRVHANAVPTASPRRTGYLDHLDHLDAAAEPAPTARVETAGPPVLTASWSDSTIVDHEQTLLVLTTTRDDSSTTMTGLGYTVTLPTNLYVADSSTLNFCQGTATATLGSGTITLSGGFINPGQLSCDLRIKVSTEYSGPYSVGSSSAASLSSGMVNSITPQTLTVTPALPKLTSSLSPTTIDALASTTLTMSIHRSDLNVSSTSSGIGLTGTLPTGLQIGTAATTDTCGGALSATAGSATFTLAGASMTGGAVTCTLSVQLTATTSGAKNLTDSSASSVTGMEAHLGSLSCGESGHVLETEGCPLTLTVHALPQTITFAQPTDTSMSRGTVTATASASSSLGVTFTSSTAAVCTVSGTTVTLVSAGSCTITAHQAGNGAYAAATDVPRSFTVHPPTAPPTSVTATAGVSSITAHWLAPSDVTGLTGYTATASPGPATCTTTGALTCVMGGTAGVTYTITVVANNPAGDSAAAGPSNEVVPTAPALGDTPPTTSLDLTTDKGLITTAVPNQDIIVIGTGFAAYSTATIVIYSSPIVLGTATTDGAGNFTKPVTIPATLAVGRHTMIAAGVDPQGAPHSLKLAVTLAAAGSGSGGGSSSSLAVTGQATDLLFLLGFAAVASGTTLLLTGRRRRTA